MKITCARGDRAREWDERHAANKQARQAARDRMYDALDNAEADLEREIRERVANSGDLKITISPAPFSDTGWGIQIGSDETKLHDTDSPLTWSYNIRLDADGSVKRETSSWSGLKATTAENIDRLKQIVETLESINSIDWTDILTKPRPNYDDYKEEEPYGPEYNGERPDFEAEELRELCEEVEGSRTEAIQSPSYNGTNYFFIKKLTSQFVTYVMITDRHLRAYKNDLNKIMKEFGYSERVKFDKFLSRVGKDFDKVSFD